MANKSKPQTVPAAVQPGTSGEEVMELQQALSDAGHYSGMISGTYDEETRAAVQKLQESFGDSFKGKASGAYNPQTAKAWEGS
jgi:peptidoglycan hydrolase-like protein with peptidoglycan-binding domain